MPLKTSLCATMCQNEAVSFIMCAKTWAKMFHCYMPSLCAFQLLDAHVFTWHDVVLGSRL